MTYSIFSLQALSQYLLCALISLTATGCFLPQTDDTEDEPAPLPAAAQFIHENPAQGPIEVRFNDSLITVVQRGSVSSAISLPQGEGSFAFYSPGAATPLFETELYPLEARVYTFAFVSDEIAAEHFIDLSDMTPNPEEDQHWVRFLNLSSADSGKMWRGTDEMTILPLESNPSEYIAVEAASSAILNMTILDGPSISDRVEVSLPSGGSSLIILGDDLSAEGSVTIKAVALDIERLNLVEPGAETMTEE